MTVNKLDLTWKQSFLILASIEDFQDVIKALPQTTEIELPGRPKRFIALGIAIAAAALSSYNAYRITELNNEISALKTQTDLETSELCGCFRRQNVVLRCV